MQVTSSLHGPVLKGLGSGNKLAGNHMLVLPGELCGLHRLLNLSEY